MAIYNDDDDSLVQRAQRCYKLAADAEAERRAEMRDDMRFLRLREQWPAYAVKGRNIPGSERPMLVVNRLMQFRNQVINEIRMNSPTVRVRPVDDNADIKTAEVFEGIIRHISALSNADAAIDTAAEWMVDCGLGYVQITTDYADDDSWDQEILIKRVPDPFKVYFDPFSTEPDGSDAQWALIASEVPRKEFEKQHKNIDISHWSLFDKSANPILWVQKESVIIAEYYWIDKQAETVTNPETGEKRTRYKKTCRWAKIAGDQVLDETELKCSFIPIIPVYGLDVIIDGKRHLEGLIRNGKDAQRMFNFAKSASAEHAALVNKAPAVGTVEQFEGHPEWDDLNTPYAKLTYNPHVYSGQMMPPPSRLQAPNPSSAWIQLEQSAIQDMQASLGIYDAALSNNPNEQSGKALLSLQRQASQGTFHYSDNLGRSLKHVGRILVEMIPQYYSTRQVARIIGEDGTTKHVQLNPDMPVAQADVDDGSGIQSIYNLGVGKYDVVCDVGPSYATRRQEASESMQAVLQTPLGQGLAAVAGDIIVKQFDWPMSQELSERVKKSMDPKLTQDDQDGAPPPEMLQAQQQMEQMATQMEQMSQVIQQLQDERQLKEAELQIKQYEAETHRIAATKEAPMEEPDDMATELEWTKTHAAHLLDEERLQLERRKLEQDYELKVADLMLKKEQLELGEMARQEQSMKEDEAKETEDQEKAESGDALKEVLAQMAEIHKAHQEQMGGIAKAIEAVSRPRKKSIVFDKATGKPVGIEES